MPTKIDYNKELQKALTTFAKKMEQIKKMQAALFADMQKALDKKIRKPSVRAKKISRKK